MRSGDLFTSQRSATDRYTADELRRFIDEIREEGPARGLTKWEADFVDSVAEQLEQRGRLTDTQIDKLDAIYAERTP